jgi:hypothetical protein
MGNTLSLGSSVVTASAGSGGTGQQTNPGGAGGAGRIAIYYTTSTTGSTSPTAEETNQPYYTYGIYHSPAIATPEGTDLASLRWESDLDTYGKIEMQTRTGATSDPTDGTWESWKPFTATTNYLDLNTADTDTDWTSSDTDLLTVADGDVTRNVDMFEDEDESTAGDLTKFTTSGNRFETDSGLTLTATLEAYWPLDETGGARSDAFGTNDLSDNNTVLSGTGKKSNAADFELSTSESLEIADNTSLSTGDIDFTMAAWVNFETESAGTTQMTIMSKASSGTVEEYSLYYTGATTDRIRFEMFDSAGTSICTTTDTTAVSTATWYFVVAWHDSAGNTCNIQVNNNTATSAAETGGGNDPADTAAAFHLGARDTTETAFFDGLIDEVGFWKEILSTTEKDDLYNSGNANTYPINGADSYAEHTKGSGSWDISTYDYITFWTRASQSGNSLKFGFGESAATEQEETVTIDATDTWQKVYWDLTDINPAARNAVTKLRFTNLSSSANTIYIDNVRAEKLLYDETNATISSTPNEYFQYRAIFTTTNTAYRPVLENVYLVYNGDYEIVQPDNNTVRLYNYTGDTQNLRLDVVVFGADLAEWYTVDDSEIESGDIVALTGQKDQFNVPIIEKANGSSGQTMIGAISTRAGQELGLQTEDRRLVGLSGRVPVKVVMKDNFDIIEPGDFITASNVVAGAGEKATESGMVIGSALEPLDLSSCSEYEGKCEQVTLESGETVTVGKVLAFMNVIWWGGTDGTSMASASDDDNELAVSGLEDRINTIEELLGVSNVELSGETVQGSQPGLLASVSTLTEEVLTISNDFKGLVEALGIGRDEETNTLTINANMLVTGDTNLSNTNITGDLAVGFVKISPDTNSIDILGPSCVSDALGQNSTLCAAQALHLQQNLAGNVDIFDGRIVLEPNGTINVAKIVITPTDPGAPSAGVIIIPAGQTVIIVETKALTPNSLILATPNRPVPVGAQEIEPNKFKVELGAAEPEDVKVDWLIVDAKTNATPPI